MSLPGALPIAPVEGWCAPGFEPVRDAFANNFAAHGELGAAVHIIVGGEVAVDLVGGWSDPARTTPWRPDTLVNMYSVGKAVLAVLVLQLVDAGVVSLDQPVADVWPEFGAVGKADATIAHALTHQAGVPAIREPLNDDDLLDWDRMTSAIAGTRAWYEPGARLTYHCNTFGHLIGEVIHRASGQMPGARLKALVDGLDADVWFGLPAGEQRRCADVVWAPAADLSAMPSSDGLTGDALMYALAHFNPPGYSSVGLVNTPQWRALQIGSTSGHASARGVARLYAALLEPGRLVSPSLLEYATGPRASGHCPILNDDVTFGLGFQPTSARRRLGPNPRAFGHFGTGGALGFADPDAGVAFGYVMNHVIPRWQSTRNRALIDSLFDVLADQPSTGRAPS